MQGSCLDVKLPLKYRFTPKFSVMHDGIVNYELLCGISAAFIMSSDISGPLRLLSLSVDVGVQIDYTTQVLLNMRSKLLMS